jgi:Tfp pilus assembly protein PilF
MSVLDRLAATIARAAAAAYVNRAEVYLSVGRNAEAASDLRKALEVVTPRDPQLARKARALLGVVTRRR